jgi:hypothetical protein
MTFNPAPGTAAVTNAVARAPARRPRVSRSSPVPPKIRSWVPVAVDSPSVLNAQRSFAQWFAASDSSRPNDTASWLSS